MEAASVPETDTAADFFDVVQGTSSDQNCSEYCHKDCLPTPVLCKTCPKKNIIIRRLQEENSYLRERLKEIYNANTAKRSDDDGEPEENMNCVLDSDVEGGVIQAPEQKIPNHFLLIALIQQLCSVYITNAEKCSETFNVLCEELSGLKILPSYAMHEDFKAVCDKYMKEYITLFHSALQRAAGGDVNSCNLKSGGGHETSIISRCSAIARQLVQAKQLLEYNTSRYKEEFQELERLGKGGFGSVYKARNQLDNREYAVKKVYLSEKDHSDCLKVLREVKVLARLRHPNVAGYQSAWLEFVANENAVSSALPRSLRSSENSLISRNSVGIHKSVSDANLQWFSNSKSYKHSHLHGHNSVKNGCYTKEDSSLSGDSVSGKKFGIVLFIQMELCGMTLRQWLLEQNLEIYPNGGTVQNEVNMNIFKQIVNGVKHIHSQGLIHRDLKPSNIFLHRDKRYDGSYEYQVKIGDFGLARTDLFRADPPNGNEFSSMIEPLTPLFPCENFLSPNSTGQTLGVGTRTYASPEQLHNTNYGSKVDIYSLGIILFEIYQPFYTEMEKCIRIDEIRKGLIQEDFKEMWREQSDLILRMMSKDPNDRPTAEDILSMKIMSEKSKCVDELLTKLENERMKNKLLKRKNRKLNKYLLDFFLQEANYE